MDYTILIKEIESVFPFIKKPAGLEVSFHKVDCYDCLCLQREMEKYPNQELPKNALRWLHNEWSCLSAKGWAWVLPSFLRYCVISNETSDGSETEFLIYSLAPELKYEKDTINRLTELNKEQISCLIHFIEWFEAQEEWANYCPEEMLRAKRFLLNVNA